MVVSLESCTLSMNPEISIRKSLKLAVPRWQAVREGRGQNGWPNTRSLSHEKLFSPQITFKINSVYCQNWTHFLFHVVKSYCPIWTGGAWRLLKRLRVRTFKLSIARLPQTTYFINSTRFVKKVFTTLKLLKSIRSGYMLLHLVWENLM